MKVLHFCLLTTPDVNMVSEPKPHQGKSKPQQNKKPDGSQSE